MLMSSLLRILDQHKVEPSAVPTRGQEPSGELFSLEYLSGTAPPANSDSSDGRDRELGLLRPLLPDLPLNQSSLRGYDELVKAIEDEKKAGRSKILDLFE